MNDVAQTSEGESKQDAPKKKSTGAQWLVNLVIIVVIVVVVLYLISAYTSLNILGLDQKSSSNEWKAVFLTNGQVYFGHTANESSHPMLLTDIYYLQVIQPLQQVESGESPASANQPQLSLVKLGNELHGPQDAMHINPDHILFIEELKDDSRVVEAIDAYIAEQAEK